MAAAFSGIRVDEASDETLFLYALFQIGQAFRDVDARALRQSANTTEDLREEFRLARDDAVSLFRVPRYELRAFAVHHLIRTRRDDLHIGARFLQLVQVRGSAENGSVERLDDVVIGRIDCAASVASAMRKQARFVNIEAVGGGHMRMNIDDH